jgi:Ca2+-transporting ATPase
MSLPPFRASADQVLADLRTSAQGLSSIEASARLLADGPNALQVTAQSSAWRILAMQFRGVIVWILLCAGALSVALHEFTDALAIGCIVLLNATIGFYQEWRSARSIAALQDLASPRATVLRDGEMATVLAAALVSGDVLVVGAGDLIAADARILSASVLACNESALTGESESVTKQSQVLASDSLPLGDRSNMLFMGTSVVAGSGRAVVVASGMRTEVGRIAALMTDASRATKTPLEGQLDAFGRLLVWIAVGIVAILFGLGLLRGTPLLDLIMSAVSLAVAAVPEGLPAIVTVALSLGAMRMARQHALVRKLAAVETLGATSVICTDKTGTLTVGEMTVRGRGNQHERSRYATAVNKLGVR